MLSWKDQINYWKRKRILCCLDKIFKKSVWYFILLCFYKVIENYTWWTKRYQHMTLLLKHLDCLMHCTATSWSCHQTPIIRVPLKFKEKIILNSRDSKNTLQLGSEYWAFGYQKQLFTRFLFVLFSNEKSFQILSKILR